MMISWPAAVLLVAALGEQASLHDPPQSLCKALRGNKGVGEPDLLQEQRRILFIMSKKTGGSTIGGVLRSVADHYNL